MTDICCIGHITKDKIVTPNRTVYMAGGTSFYFAYAINQLPKDVTFSLVTAMDPTETEPVDRMRKAGINVMLNASRNTVFFENRYFGENQNERKQRVLAKADPFTIPQLKDVEAKVFHLGSLLSDDFSPEVVEYLGHVLPAAIFGMLIVYCLKGITPFSGSHGIPEALALLATIALHKWKHQTLLSVAGGTFCYVLLVQLVF